MRLKKGTKVEVMNKEEGLIGSWCPATIVSGNGRSYYVIYNPNSACSDVQAETVTKKAIRPCPPPVRGIKDLASGDIVEVNHNQLWKAAIILNANSRNNYTVSLLGYMGVFNCHRHQLRIRQVWKDDKWFVIGKGTQSCSIERRRPLEAREKLHVQNSCFRFEQRDEVPIPHMLMKETTKRKLPFGPSGLGMHHILPQKRRVVEKDVGQLQIHSENPLNLGKGDYLHSSSRNRRTRFIKVDIGGRGDSFHLRTSTTLDAESHTSSVSSCNANSGDLACSFINHCRTYDADEASDAESICGKEYKEKTNPQNRKDKSLSRAHSLELRTYSHVVKALFASGPLSWEEETNMSNLRQSLHISDDEHLALVRSLVSSGTRVLIC